MLLWATVSKTRKLIVIVPEDLYRAAAERARAEDRSLASLVRLALRLYLGQDREPGRKPR